MSNNNRNRNKEAASQSSPNHFSREWYRSQSGRDRKLFESMSIGLVSTLIIFVFSITKKPNEDAYFKVHGALFVICIFIFLLMIIRRKDIKEVFRNSWKALTQFNSVGIAELTDVIFMSSVLLAAVSILFIIELSFLSNYGIRIGAVVAVGLFRVLRNVFRSFMK